MALADHIAACNRHDPADYWPLWIGDVALGRVRPAFARRLAGFAGTFEVTDGGVRLDPRLTTTEARTAALGEAVVRLAEAGDVPGLRREMYPVAPAWGAPPLAVLDRGAVPSFGTIAWGVHVNGVIAGGDEPVLWIGERATDRNVAPGKLDNMVAGGQPAGLSLADNVVKEAEEEAGVPEALARTARPAGVVSYVMAVPEGLRRDVLFVWDLVVPADFTPVNSDGEVARFVRMPAREAVAIAASTDRFKFNVNLAIIDFALRHGILDPEAPEYAAIARDLRRPLG
ncbi:MAG: DUF4743 domain-containing protein [Alphaproteobacteria bacterium]